MGHYKVFEIPLEDENGIAQLERALNDGFEIKGYSTTYMEDYNRLISSVLLVKLVTDDNLNVLQSDN